MALASFTVKDALSIRDDILRTIKNGLVKQGVATPYVGPASEWFIVATALGNEMAVVGANGVVKADAQMPDSAVGEDLARIADLLDLEKQPAAGSLGNVTLESSASSPIETSRELTDTAGLRYKVAIGGTYANGASVPIEAVDKGAATNHPAGYSLQWVSAPPFASDKALVATGGLINGIDAEDDETLRARVIAVYQNPPGAGNWEHVAELAEQASPSVQKAFVYPAVQGPASVHVVVTGAPTATSKSRVVATATLDGIVAPYIKGKLPEHAHIVTTTVSDVNADVAIGISIPESPTADPPGAGGGWKNATPWPAPDGVTYFTASVSVVVSSTQFTVVAYTLPVANVSRIAWFSPTEWKLYTALITSFTGVSGDYAVTIDRPFTGITVGSYIWPDCQNAKTYVDAVVAHFALMGPGEKTTNVSALQRGYRHPLPVSAFPHYIGPAMLRSITSAGVEVLATQFLHRTDGASTINGAAGRLTPQVPAAVTLAANILVPRHIAFYRIA